MKVLVALSCLTLCPMDCSPSGSSVHGIFQARVLEWVAISFSRGSSQPRDWTCVSPLRADFLTFEPLGKPRQSLGNKNDLCVCVCVCVCVLVAQLRLTLCNLMGYSLPGSSVHRDLQERILQWFAIRFSRRYSWPRDWTWVYLHCRQILITWATV